MSRVLFIQGDSRLLNPTLDETEIAAAYQDDAEAARSEWGGEFRADIASFLSDELIDGAIVPGQVANAAQPGNTYVSFTDPSGGRSDAFTLAIAHQTAAGRIALDKLLIESPPFDPGRIAERFGEALGAYGLDRVMGDQYGGDWVPSTFARFGITYEPAPLAKSQIYSEVLPLFTARRVELLDIDRLVTELRLLERRPRAGGRGDIVDHPPRAHDDAANAACGALWLAGKQIPMRDGVSASVGQTRSDYDPLNYDEDRARSGSGRPYEPAPRPWMLTPPRGVNRG